MPNSGHPTVASPADVVAAIVALASLVAAGIVAANAKRRFDRWFALTLLLALALWTMSLARLGAWLGQAGAVALATVPFLAWYGSGLRCSPGSMTTGRAIFAFAPLIVLVSTAAASGGVLPAYWWTAWSTYAVLLSAWSLAIVGTRNDVASMQGVLVLCLGIATWQLPTFEPGRIATILLVVVATGTFWLWARTRSRGSLLVVGATMIGVLAMAIASAATATLTWIAAAFAATVGVVHVVESTDARTLPAPAGRVRVPDQVHAGTLIAHRYRVGRFLGRGASGRVFLARDEALGRDVVVKEIIHVDDVGARDALREARAAGQTLHPNVVTILDVYPGPRASYVIAEYVPGGTLAQRVEQSGPPTREQALRIVDGVLAGLDAVHRLDIVHRDLKPENILMAGPSFAKISDFGLAKVAGATEPQGTTRAGTPGFMAPEQDRGEETTAQTDLWAAGRLLEFLIPAPRPTDIDALIASAKQPRPDQRFADAGAMRAALRSVGSS